MSDSQEALLRQISSTFTKNQLLDLLYTEDQILENIQRRGLQQFLLRIDSADLREAAALKERQGNEAARAKRVYMKKNVLNFTIDELVRLNWEYKCIKFEQYQSHFAPKMRRRQFSFQRFGLKDHLMLGMNLVQIQPEKYEVGKRSEHYNHSE